MNFGSYFGSSPRTPQWVTNLRGLLPLFTRPRSTKLMTSNFELSKNGSPTSLVPSTSSFTRYGNWKQRGTLTTNSQTCASPLPSSCASSWPAWQAGFPPFGQRTFEQLKALRTRTTHSNWWTQSNLKMTSSPTRLFHRPSNPDSLLALNPDSQATIITTAFKLRTDRTDRRRTRSSDAATITATTSLIFNGTTTNDGGTGNSGEEARAATTNLATDETSRRATSTILRRMASYYKRPQHPRRREGLQDTVPASSPGVTITSSNSPMVSGSDGGHGQRSVRFDGQGGDRVRKWARLYKSSLYHPQENGRTSSSPQPQSTESVPSFQTLQNGNHPTCLSTNKPGRLFDIYRPARRFPTRTDASVFSKVPSVSMAGPALSIQSPPVRPLLSPTSLHQGSPPSPAMGAQQGDTDIGLPGRFDHRGSDEGALVRGNEVSAQQTRALGVSGQGIQVQPHPINDSATPGLEIDTVSMSLKVPGQKIRDLRREASKLINKTTCTIRQLASFIGKAVAMTAAVFPARLKVQRLLAVKIQALKSGASWSDLISIPHEATAELLWWRTNLQQWNGQSWIVANPQVDIYTDASSSGWGVVINNKSHSGIWNTQQQSRHINYKELLTVFIALKRPSVQGRTVNIISDNVTTIAYINHFGGTRSPELMRLATTLWNWCLSTGTRIRTTYVPSAFNPADAPSRRLTGQLEWAIDRKFFRRLDQQWGPHHVDLFASPINHHLPRYMTWKPSEGAVGHDALQHLWKPLGNVYLCPPWNLISPALQKIKQEKIMATIITPHWPSAVWFPTIKAMTTAPPIHIPRHQVLPAPGNAPDILEKNPPWSLCAWRINGAASWTRAGTTTRPPL